MQPYHREIAPFKSQKGFQVFRFSILSPCGLIMKATSEKCIYAANCLPLDLIMTGSVGKSADSTFLSASVDDPDDAFVGFTYVAPMEEVLHEWEASARDKQIKKSASASLCAVWWSKDLFRDWNIACAVESRRSQDLLHPPWRSRARCLDSLALLFGWRSFHCLTMTGCFLWIVLLASETASW